MVKLEGLVPFTKRAECVHALCTSQPLSFINNFMQDHNVCTVLKLIIWHQASYIIYLFFFGPHDISVCARLKF